MPGQRRCTAHHHVFAPDDIAPEGTFAWVMCGSWCPVYIAEHTPRPRTSPPGDVNDLDALPGVRVSSTGSWLDAEGPS